MIIVENGKPRVKAEHIEVETNYITIRLTTELKFEPVDAEAG